MFHKMFFVSFNLDRKCFLISQHSRWAQNRKQASPDSNWLLPSTWWPLGATWQSSCHHIHIIGLEAHNVAVLWQQRERMGLPAGGNATGFSSIKDSEKIVGLLISACRCWRYQDFDNNGTTLCDCRQRCFVQFKSNADEVKVKLEGTFHSTRFKNLHVRTAPAAKDS